MSHYIVLVKQVPDVTQITDNAFDPETGNLMRGKLQSVINELDAQALAFTNKMRQCQGTRAGKVVALTMGPPMAEEVLRYSLSRCADIAVLLTDRVLGGADTWATANPLAHAVRKIVKELFQGDDDYYIISGMQSVDGDTAQVPAQMAEELDIPCVAYATDVQLKDGHFDFTRIISGGSQVVKPKKVPAIVTVAKYEFPLFATVQASRRANHAQLIQWNAEDVQAKAVGVKGSKTRVIRVFPPPKTSRKCREVKSIDEFARVISLAYQSKNGDSPSGQEQQKKSYVLPARRSSPFDRGYEGTSKESDAFVKLREKLKEYGIDDVNQVTDEVKEKILASSDGVFNMRALDTMLEGFKAVNPAYQGQVWVVAEHTGSAVHPATFELIGKARDLADSLETQVGVVLAGKNVRPECPELIAAGADKVYVIENDLLEEFDPGLCRKAIADLVGKYWPQITLFAATPQGRVLAPMVSYRLDCGLTADCTSLDIRDSSRKGEIAVLMQTRPALGGNVMATICTKDSRCQMATARPGVMKRLPPDPARQGEIIVHDVSLNQEDRSLDIITTEMGSGQVNFDAEVIVSGGKGMPDKATFNRLLSSLTDAISRKLDTPVERGASRAAVEQGYIERVHQVGQTGTAVGPKLYLAMGISGAIQHMIGVANSETIFAINNDPHAPILKQCDYYMIGNVEEIVPELVDRLGA